MATPAVQLPRASLADEEGAPLLSPLGSEASLALPPAAAKKKPWVMLVVLIFFLVVIVDIGAVSV